MQVLDSDLWQMQLFKYLFSLLEKHICLLSIRELADHSNRVVAARSSPCILIKCLLVTGCNHRSIYINQAGLECQFSNLKTK